ncbi:MAG: trigger factor [Deltaproteobacteria bacterium]|nr:trigger factor [Deltaproteobacteria bacterium]
MQVSVEQQGNLKRKMRVEVPHDKVASAYDEVYQKIKENLKVDGFRPGKFPKELAEKRFRELLRHEATRTLVPQYLDQALKDQQLSPATDPVFLSIDVEKGKPLCFEVEFEVVPEFDLLPVSKFKLAASAVKVDAAEVNARVEELRKARALPQDKGGEPAAKGDILSFDFEGTFNGKPVAGMDGKGQRIEIGAHTFLEAFEEQLPGVKAGEKKEFQLPLPDDFPNKELAGKSVQISLTANKVERKVQPELDVAFFKAFGDLETLEAFQDHVKKQIEGEKKREQDAKQVEELADQVRDAYTFEIPEQLTIRHVGEVEERLTKDDPELAKTPKKLAERREEEMAKITKEYRLRFVVDKIAKEKDLKPDTKEIQQQFTMQAYMLGKNPHEIIQTDIGDMLIHRIREDILMRMAMMDLAGQILAGKP